jgi:hypothetical protein
MLPLLLLLLTVPPSTRVGANELIQHQHRRSNRAHQAVASNVTRGRCDTAGGVVVGIVAKTKLATFVNAAEPSPAEARSFAERSDPPRLTSGERGVQGRHRSTSAHPRLTVHIGSVARLPIEAVGLPVPAVGPIHRAGPIVGIIEPSTRARVLSLPHQPKGAIGRSGRRQAGDSPRRDAAHLGDYQRHDSEADPSSAAAAAEWLNS